MSFAWPQLFWLLLLPAGLLAWELSHRRRAAAGARPKIMRAEAGASSLKLSAFETRPVQRNARPRYWLGLGLALCIAALARPQWGRIEEPVFDQSREIMLAVDLSRSMLTPDVRPTRLERAKLLIQSLLEKLAGERVGLVVFSGTSFLQCPLSADYEILREFLPSLNPSFLPEGGTNYRSLLDTAAGAFAGSATADRFLIILSDGEATDNDWKPRVEELKTKGIRVIGLGIGTATGAMIPDGAGGFVKDDRGAVVMSKLENSTLQELAQATGGVYRDASTWVDLAGLLKETVEAGRKGKFIEKNTVRLAERFQWPLAFGLWCLFVSCCYEFPVRPRPRDLTLPTAGGKRATVKTQAGSRPAPTPATVALIAFCLFAAGTLLPAPVRAALAVERPSATTIPSAGSPTPETSPSAALAKIVGRLSNAENRTARDWAELGRETVIWGSQLRSQQRPVSEGPVRDALGAVDLGAKLDAKATDWAKLREELDALLKNPDQDDQQQNQDQNKQKDQDKQKQEQKDQENQPGGDKSKSDDQKEQQNQDKQDSKDNPEQKPGEQKKPGEKAFGEMNQDDKSPPPPPSGDMQKVGGAQDKKDGNPEPLDPNLAIPMQKLDQLRNQDSPAQLFQLMEGDPKPTKKPAKDW